MESLIDLFKIIWPNFCTAHAELNHVFFTIPIYHKYQIYFRFIWCIKNCLSSLQCSTYHLHHCIEKDNSQSHFWWFLLTKKYQCGQNICVTVNLLESLGLTIHTEKSVFDPIKYNELLGFVINSIDTITLMNKVKA